MSQNHFIENILKTIMLAIIAVILIGYIPFKIDSLDLTQPALKSVGYH